MNMKRRFEGEGGLVWFVGGGRGEVVLSNSSFVVVKLLLFKLKLYSTYEGFCEEGGRGREWM
jgi:hypothetical protein